MPNDSTSGFTDEQLQQIREVVQSVADGSTGQITESFGTLSDGIVSSVSQSVPSALASALDSRSGDVQAVSLVGDQWESLSGYVLLSGDSLRLQNSIVLFELLLVAIIIGVLFFGHFSKGFRRD